VSESFARLCASRLPRVAFVSHAFGGGVARHIGDLARILEGEAEILLLEPFLKSFVALRWLRRGETFTLWLRLVEDWERLVQLLDSVGIDRVHFHHVHGWPQAVLGLPTRLGCPYDVTLHDFFPACPEYHLTDSDARFCGGEAQCHRCLDRQPAQWPLSIDAWREVFARMLDGAGRVIAPSEDAARRLHAFFPRVHTKVWPHPWEPGAPPSVPMRILVPGALSPEKGLGLLEACVNDAWERRLPLHFRVLGYTAYAIPAWPLRPYSLSGEYPEGRLAELLALERGDALFFPAQCPETFSYTLSACLDTALPIVATDLGALPERLARRPNARIVPWNSSAREVNDAFMGIAAASPGVERNAEAMSAATYRKLYVEALPDAERTAGAAAPALESHWRDEPREALTPRSLAALLDDAVGCGRATSLAVLRGQVREADAEIEAARAGVAPDQSPQRSRIRAPLRAFARLLKR